VSAIVGGGSLLGGVGMVGIVDVVTPPPHDAVNRAAIINRDRPASDSGEISFISLPYDMERNGENLG